jgi:hypothetical protein
MNIFRRLTLSMTRKSGWKLAVIFGFSVLLVLALLLARANGASAASSPSGATITSDQADYAPGATVTLTGAGWASDEAVHINVNDSVGNTWSLDSNPDPKADGSGGFTYSFSLPSSFIASYSVTATGPTSGTATTTFTDTSNPCPNDNPTSWKTDNQVGADFSTSGLIRTYTFSSFVNESSSGGIPGLIEYCVYPASVPHNVAVQNPLLGADGSQWDFSQGSSRFSFVRPNGDPTNIPLDGTTGITMGTATWSSSLPTSQVIVLHVNDPAECSALYGSGTLTCFVLPGTPQQAKDLTVSKTATASFTRTFTWGITKSVDQTLVQQSGTTATFNYTVTVTHDSGTDSDWQVTGTITVNNPNGFDITGVDVADADNNGGNCTVTGGTNVTVLAGKSVTLSYTCTYGSAPSPSKGSNTATATWDGTKYNTPDSSASGSADFDFGSVSPKLVDDSVTVNDTLGGSLGTVSSTDPSPKTFTYSHTVTGTPGKCVTQDNTATFTTNTTGTTGSDSKSVKLCVGADLTVSKTASPSFTRTYAWNITKKVDKTLVEQIGGGTAIFNYTVNVSETGFTDSNWAVSGTITVTNPNDWEPITANVSDAIDGGGICTVNGGTSASVPASSSVTLNYTCTYASAPSPSSGNNTATATWDPAAAYTVDSSASGSAGFAFTTPTTTVNKTVTVTDTFNKGTPTTLQPSPLTATDSTPYTSQTYTYSRTLTVPTFNCVTYPNTATIVETGQTASAKVEVCGPAKTGALTMGYWQNKNGQGIILNKSGTNCQALATFLHKFNPFSDLTATTCGSSPALGAKTATGVVGYVYNVLKAATCSGPTTAPCNAMLKAQMLATALDVYFSATSDPTLGTLGGNQIGATGDLGQVSIDLTKICHMIDSTNGTATCSGTFEDVSTAFGATSMTVANMLLYQNTSDPAADGGAVWYSNNKAMQVLAKDAFDAINNQVAFAP